MKGAGFIINCFESDGEGESFVPHVSMRQFSSVPVKVNVQYIRQHPQPDVISVVLHATRLAGA